MIRRNPITALAFVIAALVVLDLMLLISGRWLLVGERRYIDVLVEPHVSNGNRGFRYEMIECSFFTGRSLQTTRDYASRYPECPFLIQPYR